LLEVLEGELKLVEAEVPEVYVIPQVFLFLLDQPLYKLEEVGLE